MIWATDIRGLDSNVCRYSFWLCLSPVSGSTIHCTRVVIQVSNLTWDKIVPSMNLFSTSSPMYPRNGCCTRQAWVFWCGFHLLEGQSLFSPARTVTFKAFVSESTADLTCMKPPSSPLQDSSDMFANFRYHDILTTFSSSRVRKRIPFKILIPCFLASAFSTGLPNHKKM